MMKHRSRSVLAWMTSALVSAALVLIATSPSAHAQSAPSSSSLRPVTEEDAQKWQRIASSLLAPDGSWFAYELSAARPGAPGPVEIVVRNLRGEGEQRFSAGPFERGAGKLRMSKSGRWVAFLAADATNNAAPRLVVVQPGGGLRREIPGVREFHFVGDTTETILFRRDSAVAVGNEPRKSDLVLFEPERNSEQILGQAPAVSVSPTGNHAAWADGSGLHVLRIDARHAMTLEREGGAAYDGWSWSENGDGLAVIQRRDRGAAQLVVYTSIRSGAPRKRVVDPASTTGFPAGYLIAPSFRWRSDERGLYFGVVPAQETRTTTTGRIPITIWHTADAQLPMEKRATERRKRSDWCFLPERGDRVVRISDDALANVEPHQRGRYSLGYDLRSYGWLNESVTGSGTSQARDYYLVDNYTGARSLLIKNLKVVTVWGLSALPQLSPDGKVFLYQDGEGDYIARDVPDGRGRNLTAGLPTRFYYPENDPRITRRQVRNRGAAIPALQGWTRDGAYVLMSDYFDVWALGLNGAKAINLTRLGTGKDKTFARVDLENPDALLLGTGPQYVDLERPLYFHVTDLKSAETGLARADVRAGKVDVLNMEYADIQYRKAAASEVILYSRMTSVESRNYFLATADWKQGARLTDVNPQQDQFVWSPGTLYLRYRTSRGDERAAVLYLPAGYVKGQKYPAVMQVYLVGSVGVHVYRRPFDVYNSAERYVRAGYAVLVPDIIPRINEPGEAALESALGAIDEATRLGIVDPERIGLMGHSYGAFETYYMVSKTDRFKAAAPSAGMTNLWSDCGLTYIGQGPKSANCETSQPFLSGPWWDVFDAYINNSPLRFVTEIKTPLLMIHGDRDDTVAFSQSVEMFNALRRLEKPAVLLQYIGEGHSLAEPAALDAESRTEEFFDHFLRGKPAPAWWSDGVARYAEPP